MTNIEVRFLFLYAGFPSIAYAKTLTSYDRRIAEQITANMRQVVDYEDREYLASVEREIELEELKYGEPYDETRSPTYSYE